MLGPDARLLNRDPVILASVEAQAAFVPMTAYTDGVSVPQDYDQAFEWYSKAARGGNVRVRRHHHALDGVVAGTAGTVHGSLTTMRLRPASLASYSASSARRMRSSWS